MRVAFCSHLHEQWSSLVSWSHTNYTLSLSFLFLLICIFLHPLHHPWLTRRKTIYSALLVTKEMSMMAMKLWFVRNVKSPYIRSATMCLQYPMGPGSATHAKQVQTRIRWRVSYVRTRVAPISRLIKTYGWVFFLFFFFFKWLYIS